MPRTVSPLLPSTHERLRQLGERLRLARRRRRLPATQVAARAGMAPMTLRSVERGGPGVTLGAYAAVMQVLGVDKDLDLLVAADPTGRALEDARLSVPRAPRVATAPTPPAPATPSARPRAASASRSRSTASVTGAAGFASARALASLLEMPPRPRSTARRR